MADRVKKLLFIVVVTLLIWVWADISNDVVLSDQNATIRVSPNISKDLWVSIGIQEGISPSSLDVPITIDLKGPSGRMDVFKREHLPLEVDYYPEMLTQEQVKTGEFSVPIVKYIQEDPVIRKLGLNVESCEPATIKVKVEKLVKKQLKVVCIDENNTVIEEAKAQPAIIEMLVKDYWSGEKLNAYVKLTGSQIDDARRDFLELTPYVEMEPQRLRYTEELVKITIPSYTEQKITDAISGPRIGFVYNLDMIDKYNVEIIENLTIVQYRATSEASKAYKDQQYHVLLDILQEDAQPGEDGSMKIITRKVKYNFPTEYVKAGEISALENGESMIVSFKLVPLVK